MTAATAKIQGNQVKAHASCSSVGAATKEVESLSHSQDIRIKYVSEDRGHDTPCWVWQSSLANGYAKAYLDGRNVRVHRWTYEQKYGPIPDGQVCDHLCRVRNCVNPDHIELVTQTENTRRGVTAKLTAEEVAQIKRRALCGETQIAIGLDYGVAQTTIASIVTGASWRDIEPAANPNQSHEEK